MHKGWRISYTARDREMKNFLIGTAGQEAATEQAASGSAGVSVVAILPSKGGEFEKFSLVEGELIDTARWPIMPTGTKARKTPTT